MNAYQYLSSINGIKYKHLIESKKYPCWAWAIQTYCPKYLQGKLWMVYLNCIVDHQKIIEQEE